MLLRHLKHQIRVIQTEIFPLKIQVSKIWYNKIIDTVNVPFGNGIYTL